MILVQESVLYDTSTSVLYDTSTRKCQRVLYDTIVQESVLYDTSTSKCLI